MTKILIADDHPIYRSGIRSEIESMSGMHVVAEATNGLEAYQMIIATRPNIAILDLEMPFLSGLDVCKKVLAEKHNTKFVILTMHQEREYFNEAMQCGVLGYLLKDSAGMDLRNCLESIFQGHKYVSKDIQNYLKHHESTEKSDELQAIIKLLTPTERVILKLISEGKSSIDIGNLLFISPNTVDNHRANMARKLQLEGKNSLLKFSIGIKSIL